MAQRAWLVAIVAIIGTASITEAYGKRRVKKQPVRALTYKEIQRLSPKKVRGYFEALQGVYVLAEAIQLKKGIQFASNIAPEKRIDLYNIVIGDKVWAEDTTKLSNPECTMAGWNAYYLKTNGRVYCSFNQLDHLSNNLGCGASKVSVPCNPKVFGYRSHVYNKISNKFDLKRAFCVPRQTFGRGAYRILENKDRKYLVNEPRDFHARMCARKSREYLRKTGYAGNLNVNDDQMSALFKVSKDYEKNYGDPNRVVDVACNSNHSTIEDSRFLNDQKKACELLRAYMDQAGGNEEDSQKKVPEVKAAPGGNGPSTFTRVFAFPEGTNENWKSLLQTMAKTCSVDVEKLAKIGSCKNSNYGEFNYETKLAPIWGRARSQILRENEKKLIQSFIEKSSSAGLGGNSKIEEQKLFFKAFGLTISEAKYLFCSDVDIWQRVQGVRKAQDVVINAVRGDSALRQNYKWADPWRKIANLRNTNLALEETGEKEFQPEGFYGQKRLAVLANRNLSYRDDADGGDTFNQHFSRDLDEFYEHVTSGYSRFQTCLDELSTSAQIPQTDTSTQ